MGNEGSGFILLDYSDPRVLCNIMCNPALTLSLFALLLSTPVLTLIHALGHLH